MTNTTLTTINDKIDWLTHRYWKFGQDDLFLDYLCCDPRFLLHLK